MAVNLSPVGGVAAQFFTNNGTPLTGGKLYSYLAGTTTPAATYTSASGSTAHTNPIVLDSAGRVPNGGEVWLTDGLQYKFVLKTSTDVLIATYDNIVGINSNFVNYTNEQEIQTATAGQTVFTLTTMQYQPGTNSLSVFVDGVNQYGPGAQYAYLETDSTTVTFVSGLHVGAEVKFTTSNFNASSYGDAFQISYTPPFTGAVATNVGDKLALSVNVEDFGAVGDGVIDDTSAIQIAIDSLQSGQTLIFSKNYKITSSLTVTGKSRIRLTGKGQIFLSNASTNAYIFQLVGTIDNLEIDGLTLVGDGLTSGGQTAIGCNSGQTISNTRFHDLTITDINVGISHNAYLGGSWTNALCYNNSLKNMLGTVPGSGYGIHIARATNVRVYDNIIDNASRHSIYQAAGANVNNVIHNNLIVNHRKDVADLGFRCGIVCSRSSDVTISNNKFVNCYDGQIEISHDTSTSANGENILVIGNTFTARKNVVPSIVIGEQADPGAYSTFKITIHSNTFDCSYVDAAGSNDINILNGTEIFIENNTFRRYGYSGVAPVEFIGVGSNSYVSSDADIGNIKLQNNTASIDVNSAAARFCYICTQLCTGSSSYLVKDNYLSNIGNTFYFDGTPTNVNSKFKFSTTAIHTWSVAPNTVVSAAISVTGCKTTSSVTVRPDSAAMVAPTLAISGCAATSAVNTVELYAVNANTASTSTQTNMVHYIHVEDF